jgi:hypothetical protein
MARRTRTNESDSAEGAVSTLPEEATVSTTTEAPAEGTKTEKAPVDLTAFQAAVDAAVAEHDTSTGTVPEGLVAAVQGEYRSLDGLAAKNAAKKVVNDSMREAMNEMNIVLARAYMSISDQLTAGSGTREKAEKVPVDPTEAFVQRLGALQLAAELVAASRPEGVSEDYVTQLNQLLADSREGASGYLAWTQREPVAEGEEDTPEPEASSFVKAAVKLSQGKAARVSAGRSGGSTYTGERRDIGQHISEAFADVESGTFLTVAEIRKHNSSQYTSDNPPSAGAISARLFPKSGKCTVEGIEPDTNEKGNRGARKL